VEQLFKDYLSASGRTAGEDVLRRFAVYASMIHHDNALYNLTGLKTEEDIAHTLVLGSALPVWDLVVPRGTRYVDVGTGSGIPGVVLAVMFPQLSGVLIDSNRKKMEFIRRVAAELGLENLTVLDGRAEDFGKKSEMRNAFDWSFTRAFGPLYYSIEFCLPMLKKGGHLYVYSTLKADTLSDPMKKHVSSLGGVLLGSDVHKSFGIVSDGVLIEKTGSTPGLYPRKFPVVKREAAIVAALEGK
jgi:16S rRNA (guanine527-N7)-methyltransferase